MKTYFGSIQKHSFEINNLLEHKNIYMVFDENTLEYLEAFERIIKKNFKYLVIPSGEENKTLDNVNKIWDFLNLNHAKRGDFLLIIGGGMTGDLAGFAASTFKRGMKFILFPSTLLSMVDSSIGGKTGFNYNFIKNNIGTLAFPEAVFYDINFLKTLPENHIISGLSEVYKHSIIGDPTLWNYLKSNPKEFDYNYIIERSYSLKSKIVAIDPNENIIRKKLNFGHTVGHAIESFYLNKKQPLLHGFAIAKGMIIESFIAKKEKILNDDDFQEIRNILTKYFSSYIDFKIKTESLIKLMKFDKKNTSKKINFSLPSSIGEVSINHEIELKKVESYLLEFFQND